MKFLSLVALFCLASICAAAGGGAKKTQEAAKASPQKEGAKPGYMRETAAFRQQKLEKKEPETPKVVSNPAKSSQKKVKTNGEKSSGPKGAQPNYMASTATTNAKTMTKHHERVAKEEALAKKEKARQAKKLAAPVVVSDNLLRETGNSDCDHQLNKFERCMDLTRFLDEGNPLEKCAGRPLSPRTKFGCKELKMTVHGKSGAQFTLAEKEKAHPKKIQSPRAPFIHREEVKCCGPRAEFNSPKQAQKAKARANGNAVKNNVAEREVKNAQQQPKNGGKAERNGAEDNGVGGGKEQPVAESEEQFDEEETDDEEESGEEDEEELEEAEQPKQQGFFSRIVSRVGSVATAPIRAASAGLNYLASHKKQVGGAVLTGLVAGAGGYAAYNSGLFGGGAANAANNIEYNTGTGLVAARGVNTVANQSAGVGAAVGGTQLMEQQQGGSLGSGVVPAHVIAGVAPSHHAVASYLGKNVQQFNDELAALRDKYDAPQESDFFNNVIEKLNQEADANDAAQQQQQQQQSDFHDIDTADAGVSDAMDDMNTVADGLDGPAADSVDTVSDGGAAVEDVAGNNVVEQVNAADVVPEPEAMQNSPVEANDANLNSPANDVAENAEMDEFHDTFDGFNAAGNVDLDAPAANEVAEQVDAGVNGIEVGSDVNFESAVDAAVAAPGAELAEPVSADVAETVARPVQNEQSPVARESLLDSLRLPRVNEQSPAQGA